ncbi:mannose-6-phosphate isomerase, class I [Jeotgalibacillus haloalkalitolerans]|uniref:Mannose-6-phosphate isomerase n=1 Tax=Jeotgalibacillus haloalkalitolerans TaxID=3104292 RepID=A0ABU5KHJ6_9BACL|nr:mannose-6-phosphate isomerase, class I [Jeotgalibacillus sp. HH7-29]MDZ5710689.1 mannose-6-phosphate isomerase, class I [Jeotgalibacillus sp. HH7-29]
MTEYPMFFEPIFKERIWGGNQLKSFGYDLPFDHTGECWGIAAHRNGQSVIKNGAHKGKTLGELWKNERHLFEDFPGERFPLLTKILDAAQDLSVQVHPDNEYAEKHEGEPGKTECWYVIDCEEGAEIVYGHHAKSRKELEFMIKNAQWEKLLHKVPVKKGDFYFVPSGTIHAIGAGITILETQQNSDTTYRVYDYDRKDQNGNKRELHIEKSIAVTTVPASIPEMKETVEVGGDRKVIHYVENEYFTVEKWQINGSFVVEQPYPFQLVSVISGFGSVTTAGACYEFNKGDHFLLPCGIGELEFKGESELIIAHV